MNGWLVFATLFACVYALPSQSRTETQVPFSGAWISSAVGDRIVAATISNEGGEWSLEVSQACQDQECPWPRLPLALFKNPADAPSYSRAIAVRRSGSLVTTAALHLEEDVLVIELVETRFQAQAVTRGTSRLVRRSSSTQSPTPTAEAAASLEDAIVAAYRDRFGERISRPAIYESRAATCGDRVLTSTAYLKVSDTASALLVLYVSPDGHIISKPRRIVMTPAGTMHVLVALLNYPETVGSDGPSLWKASQAQINADHAAWARGLGLDRPLVTFENTNVVLDRGSVDQPQDGRAVRAVLERRGLTLDRYQIIMTIDLDPQSTAGGRSVLSERSIYVGNYLGIKSPLDAKQWQLIASTAYHHEIAHHWGWEHEWSPKCDSGPMSFEPFVAAPILFGWADVDGDGVPEIIDRTPYGRNQ